METCEDVPSAPSTPATPGTPGAPLFGYGGGGERGERAGSFRPSDSNNGNLRRSSLLRNTHCFGFESWGPEQGNLSFRASCLFPPPPVSLARKVGAEFIGTLMLIFGGTATAIVNQKNNGSETLIGLAASSGLAVMVVILATGHISGAHLNPALTIAFAAIRHFPLKHVGELAGIAVGATVMLNILIAGETTGASMNPVRTLGPAVAAANYRDIWIYLTAPILGALFGAGIYTALKLPEEDGEEKPSIVRSFRR